MDKKLVFPRSPDDIILKKGTRHQTFRGKEVYRVRMGARGQWAAGEGVVDGAHGFRVVKISSGFRCAHFSIGDVVVFGAKILTHHSIYLKLWYSFHIRVEYQRLHENNLARRRQLMCGSAQHHDVLVAEKKRKIVRVGDLTILFAPPK